MPVTQDGNRWMTSAELTLLQAGRNLFSDEANICMFFLLCLLNFLAILETWLKIHEDLPKFIDENASNQAKAAAASALAKGTGDGKVYNIAAVIQARPELTTGKSSGSERAKCLVRMAVYVTSFSY